MNTVATKASAINQKMWLDLARTAGAVQELAEREIRVISAQCSAAVIPTVHVLPCAACTDLVACGEAAYYYEGMEGTERVKKGQFQMNGVRVIWIEVTPA